MPKSNAERQKEFHQSMKERGFTRVVVYAPSGQAREIRRIASVMRDLYSDPELITVMQEALTEAKGALSASVDENTKRTALSSVKRALDKFKDVDPI